MKHIRDSFYLADIITTAVIICGFISIIFSTENLYISSSFLVLAGIFDALDGIAARKFGSSDSGLIYDSVSDIVAFCVTPAILIYWYLDFGIILDGSISVLFLISTILHMRFFISTSDLTGCPTTIAALAVSQSIFIGNTVVVTLTSIAFSVFVLMRYNYTKDVSTVGKIIVAIIMILGIVQHFIYPYNYNVFAIISSIFIWTYAIFGSGAFSHDRQD